VPQKQTFHRQPENQGTVVSVDPGTANWTGEIKQNLGGAKFIRSEGVKIDRDINGALGIFLKGLVGS
jgi:transposase